MATVIDHFQTPEYAGVWFPFAGNREKLRNEIEVCLRRSLLDPNGILKVTGNGPYWLGENKLAGLSYAHTDGYAILIYSEKFHLGVDIERADRKLNFSATELASRYFSDQEASLFTERDGATHEKFLKLWVKKEAFAKITRLGLSRTLKTSIFDQTEVQFQNIAKMPIGYLGSVAVGRKLV